MKCDLFDFASDVDSYSEDFANLVCWKPLINLRHGPQIEILKSEIHFSHSHYSIGLYSGPSSIRHHSSRSQYDVPNPCPKSRRVKSNPSSESVKSVPFKARLGARSHPAANIFHWKLIFSKNKQLRIHSSIPQHIAQSTIAVGKVKRYFIDCGKSKIGTFLFQKHFFETSNGLLTRPVRRDKNVVFKRSIKQAITEKLYKILSVSFHRAKKSQNLRGRKFFELINW